MKVVDEFYPENKLEILTEELVILLHRLKELKQLEVEEIKLKINRYEEKKRAEEVVYQSLSPFRKFFTGRPSSQHQAVEYMVHVKERLKKIEAIKYQLRELDDILNEITEDFDERHPLNLPSSFVDELIQLRNGGGQL